DEPLEALLLDLRELPRPVECELRPADGQHVRDEDFCVDVGRLASGRVEALAGLSERARDLHADAAARAWRCSSARRASVSSARSPSNTWSRRCSVTLMRWSLTRFSGEL